MRALACVAVVGALCGSAVADRSDPVTLKPGTLAIDGKLVDAITSGKARAWAVPPLYQLAITTKVRYMTNLRYRYVVGGLVLSAKAWARISPEDRKIVSDTCREWEPKLRASWRKET